MPWLMQAAARGEIGNGADVGMACEGTLTGELVVLLCGKLVFAGAAGCGALCGFISSFLHITHLEGHSWIFEVVGLEGGATQKLQDSTGFNVCKAECGRVPPCAR